MEEGKCDRTRRSPAANDDCAGDGCSCAARVYNARQTRQHARPVCVIPHYLRGLTICTMTFAAAAQLQGQRVHAADTGGGWREKRTVPHDRALQRHRHRASNNSTTPAAAAMLLHCCYYCPSIIALHLFVQEHVAQTECLLS